MHCSDTPRRSYFESNIIQNIKTNVYLVERINGQCHVTLGGGGGDLYYCYCFSFSK